MKYKIILLWALLILSAGAVQGPMGGVGPSNLAQGIVNSSNEMVQTRLHGPDNVKKSFQETQKIYQQGKSYYDKLRAVSNLVRSARKVQQCILLVGEISDLYVNNYQKLLSDPHFTVRELSAIASGYTRLLQEGTYVLRDLQDIVNPTDLSMTDKDRLDVVDKSYAELSRLRNLTHRISHVRISGWLCPGP